jgi:hypothetical protein
MTTIEVQREKRFRRTPDVVRCHFLDMHHHLAHDVHQGVRYQILEEQPGRLRLTQDFKVLGMAKHDEVVLYATSDGRVVQEFLIGDFAGGGIELRFEPLGDDGTILRAVLRAPLRGMNALMAPLIKWQVGKITDRALEEDRRDLEGGYQPGDWARDALAAARAA